MKPQRRRALPACLLALAIAVPASAQDAMHDFAWLAGDWCGTHGELAVEEVWLERGGHLFNVTTTMRGGALVSFEFARVEARAGGTVFVAQPGGVPPTEFALVESGERRATFANPAHDFPQRVSYWRDDAGLHAEIAGPGEDGEQRIAFDYVACAADAAPVASR